MLEKDIIYRALIKKPHYFGLPIYQLLLFLGIACFVIIWIKSLLIIPFLALLYAILFFGTKWDENFLFVIIVTLKNFKTCKNKKLWGGNSYEP